MAQSSAPSGKQLQGEFLLSCSLIDICILNKAHFEQELSPWVTTARHIALNIVPLTWRIMFTNFCKVNRLSYCVLSLWIALSIVSLSRRIAFEFLLWGKSPCTFHLWRGESPLHIVSFAIRIFGQIVSMVNHLLEFCVFIKANCLWVSFVRRIATQKKSQQMLQTAREHATGSRFGWWILLLSRSPSHAGHWRCHSWEEGGGSKSKREGPAQLEGRWAECMLGTKLHV